MSLQYCFGTPSVINDYKVGTTGLLPIRVRKENAAMYSTCIRKVQSGGKGVSAYVKQRTSKVFGLFSAVNWPHWLLMVVFILDLERHSNGDGAVNLASTANHAGFRLVATESNFPHSGNSHS